MASRLPASQLKRLDLPTFGRPTMTTWGTGMGDKGRISNYEGRSAAGGEVLAPGEQGDVSPPMRPICSMFQSNVLGNRTQRVKRCRRHRGLALTLFT